MLWRKMYFFPSGWGVKPGSPLLIFDKSGLNPNTGFHLTSIIHISIIHYTTILYFPDTFYLQKYIIFAMARRSAAEIENGSQYRGA